MRYITMILPASLSLIAICPTASGQAAAEYGLGAGRAATTTAPARNLSKGINGALNKAAAAAGATEARSTEASTKEASPATTRRTAHKTAGRTPAKHSAQSGDTATATAKATPPPEPAPPAPVYEDARQIQPGIGYDELIRRFGPPTVSITTGPGKSTLLYSGEGSSYRVEIEGGKVVAPQGKTSE
jgi:hypothetical protein